MRFERHGGPPDLPAAFKAFVVGPLGGRSLDDHAAQEAAKGEFPDFAAFRDLVLIEMKHLETDQNERLNNAVDEITNEEEKPLFFGNRDARLVLGNLSNHDEIKFKIFSKLSKTIETILSKSNRQFQGYRIRNPRKNNLNICLLLNAALAEYTPETVCRAVHAKMKGGKDGSLRFPSIDIVLYISEKHFRHLPDGRLAFAIAIIEASGAIDHPWKMELVNRIVAAWADFRTGTPHENQDDIHNFDAIEDIPERLTRSEFWIIEYRRNPYLSALSLEKLRVHFHRILSLGNFFLIKGDWPKPPEAHMIENMRRFQHAIEETNRRGTDLGDLEFGLLTDAEREFVLRDLPSELIAIMTREKPSDSDQST